MHATNLIEADREGVGPPRLDAAAFADKHCQDREPSWWKTPTAETAMAPFVLGSGKSPTNTASPMAPGSTGAWLQGPRPGRGSPGAPLDVDTALVIRARTQAPIRRVMAALAERFVALRGWERLGFARLRDYATERLGLSARSLHDLAHTHAVLAALPHIATAFVAGEITWTKVRLLARVARPADEQAWLTRAQSVTASALSREVRAVNVGSVQCAGPATNQDENGEEGNENDYTNVLIRCTPRVQAKWHRARQLAWRVAGHPVRPWECGEMIAAEVLSAIPMDSEAAAGAEAAGPPPTAERHSEVADSPGHRAADDAVNLSTSSEETQATTSRNGHTTRPGTERAIASDRKETTPSGGRHENVPDGNEAGAVTAPHPEAAGSCKRSSPPNAANNGANPADEGRFPPSDTGQEIPPEGEQARAPNEERAPIAHKTGTPLPEAATGERSASALPLELPPFLRPLVTGLSEADEFDLDRRLRRVVKLEQSLDGEVGALLFQVFHEQRYRSHGAESLEEYTRERLGISPRKARALLRLERASLECPTLAQAYRDARLSWVQAHSLIPVLLIPHGHPRSRGWIDWARQVSVRRLQDDIDRALLLNETDPEAFAATGGIPPAALEIKEQGNKEPATRGQEANVDSIGSVLPGATELERQTGAQHRVSGGHINGCFPTSESANTSASAPGSQHDRQTSAQHRVSGETTFLFFHAPRDVARLFRAVLATVRRSIERQTQRMPTQGEAFEAMLEHVFDTWGALDAPTRAAHRVFVRDGWRCTVPGCSSYRNLHNHHIVFRSAGGSNDLSNRTTLCAWHHLRGVHALIVRCAGAAPDDIRFELGLREAAGPLVTFGPGERLAEDQRAGGRHAEEQRARDRRAGDQRAGDRRAGDQRERWH